VELFYWSVPVRTDPAFGRWMKRWMDAPDHPIPLQLSGLLWTTGSRSDGRDEKGGEELT
jgi:hypothetical protein